MFAAPQPALRSSRHGGKRESTVTALNSQIDHSISGDLLYGVMKPLLKVALWRGVLVGAEFLPASGPAVLIANHVGSMGPVAVAASVPIRLYPWIIADMIDPVRAAAYLLAYYVKPELHLEGRAGLQAAHALARITVPLLRSLGCIPVRHDRTLLTSLRLSEGHLAAGRCLLIFPEDPLLHLDARTGMRPFRSGFGRLGSLHHVRTSQRLAFYPTAVHATRRQVQLGSPLLYDPSIPERAERRIIARLLHSRIGDMLMAGGKDLNSGVGERR
jgi:hypothetical protein